MTFKRKRIQSKQETNLITGLITSDKICKELIPIIKEEYFISQHIAKIFGWVKSYHDHYKKAPQTNLINIYEGRKKELEAEERKLIYDFLAKLSEEYEVDENINEDLIIDNSIKYLKERSIKLLRENLDDDLEQDDIESAYKKVSSFKKVVKQTSSWSDPFEVEEIEATFAQEDEGLFSFPGILGEKVGDFKRGHFIAFLAPFKRGKTFWLLEIATLAMMNRLKVAFVTFEMKKEELNERFYKRITSTTNEGGLTTYPCFDCLSNQMGDCEKKQRKNKITLTDDEVLPEYDPKSKYKPCTFCRNHDEHSDDYIPATWFIQEKRPAFTQTYVKKEVKKFKKHFKGNVRVLSYPRFSATMSDIERDLDMLVYSEDFNPDVIITDYADIIVSEQRGESRDQVNDLWKRHARMAGERKCLVATVSQSGRSSWDSDSVNASDSSEDYRKPANLDMYFALNQNEVLLSRGIMNIAIIAHRHRFFNPKQQISVLQQLDVGQTMLDCELF